MDVQSGSAAIVSHQYLSGRLVVVDYLCSERRVGAPRLSGSKAEAEAEAEAPIRLLAAPSTRDMQMAGPSARPAIDVPRCGPVSDKWRQIVLVGQPLKPATMATFEGAFVCRSAGRANSARNSIAAPEARVLEEQTLRARCAFPPSIRLEPLLLR